MFENDRKPGLRFSIDLSAQKKKYRSRQEQFLNILFYAHELPSDLYLHMNITYDNFRQYMSMLCRKGLIKKLKANGVTGYQLTLQGKKLTRTQPEFYKYQACVSDDVDRHTDLKHRARKRQFGYLYALFDRVGIIFEEHLKPKLTSAAVFEDQWYFYTALDVKHMLNVEATVFKGSRMYGLLVGFGQIIPVYIANFSIKTYTRQEALIPILMSRYFTVPVDTAILICYCDAAVVNISKQINENLSNDSKRGPNTANYQKFFLLSSDDRFLSQLDDLSSNLDYMERLIIERYGIDTSETDSNGRYRLKIGTGFIDEHPVWVCPGNINSVILKRFIRNAELNDIESYIICTRRDAKNLEEIIGDAPVDIIEI